MQALERAQAFCSLSHASDDDSSKGYISDYRIVRNNHSGKKEKRGHYDFKEERNSGHKFSYMGDTIHCMNVYIEMRM